MRIKTRADRRDRIKHRIRKRVSGTEARPRLTVFRSVAPIYVQVVDDMTGRTIASASTVEPAVKGGLPKGAYVRVGSTNRSPDASLLAELKREAANEVFEAATTAPAGVAYS